MSDKPEEWYVCPYNRAHVIPCSRFMSHKCKDKEKLEKMKNFGICLYSSAHRVVSGKLEDHHSNCIARVEYGGSITTEFVHLPPTYNSEELRNARPVSTLDFLKEVDMKEEQQTQSVDRRIENNNNDSNKTNPIVIPDLNATNDFDPDNHTYCRGCCSSINYSSIHCNVCYLMHPQVVTLDTKRLLYIGVSSSVSVHSNAHDRRRDRDRNNNDEFPLNKRIKTEPE